jgi:hypothetical protein
VQVDWNATSNAAGYRVLRSYTPDGPWVRVADININTGNTTVAPEVVNIWSAQHTYVPAGGALSGSDTSSVFQYVELSGAGERCFKVIAYNGEVRGAASSVECSGPI